MLQTNMNQIILTTLNTYLATMQTVRPGLSERECYNLLAMSSGSKMLSAEMNRFEKRQDGRFLVMNANIAGETLRIFTLYTDPKNGRTEVDLSVDNAPPSEDVFMLIYKTLSLCIMNVIHVFQKISRLNPLELDTNIYD